MQCPKNFVIDNSTSSCECRCGLTRESCVGLYDPEGCTCYSGCDYFMECPSGEEWDLGVCGCVSHCPGVVCEENYSFDDKCECQCALSQNNCTDYEMFDPTSCRCFINMGCDYIMECPRGQHWDFGVCGCVPNECPGSGPCQENAVFDENCNCQCIEDGSNCSGFFDFGSCVCIPDGCDYIEQCPPGMRWDFGVCNCVMIECPGLVCGENNVFDENCNCQCGIDQTFCQSYEMFDSWACTCYPNWGCDYIMECPLGKKTTFMNTRN